MIDIARDVFEFLLRVVDRFVHPELAQQFLILGRRRREHVRAFPLRQLHGNVSNSAAAAVNQHALAGCNCAVSNNDCHAVSAAKGTAAARM